jgi:hypothetical protein
MLGKMSSVLSCNQIQGCSHTTTVHVDTLVLFRVTGHSSATLFIDSYDEHRWQRPTNKECEITSTLKVQDKKYVPPAT